MFDGAAAVDAAHAVPDASAKALIPDAPAPMQVRGADPAQDGGRKEVVFVDTSLANYQALEAAVKPGVEIEEIGGDQDGLAQMAKWAETHTGYDSISVIGQGTDVAIRIGTHTLTDAGLSDGATGVELAEIGSALKAGGELLVFGDNGASDTQGRQFARDLAAATGATVGVFGDPADSTGSDGNWVLQTSTGVIELQAAHPALDGGKTEVVFVDTSVTNYRDLVAAVKPGIEIELIDGGQNGLAQMAAWAGTHSGYDSITILSHGGEAHFDLGNAVINDASLGDAATRAQLAQIGAALKSGGDLVLYGCDVAAGSDGQQFVGDLAAETGAVVTASTHPVGENGGWALDYSTGAVVATRFAAPDFLADLGGWGTNSAVSIAGGSVNQGTTTVTGNYSVIGGSAYSVVMNSIPSGVHLFAGTQDMTSGGAITTGGTWNLSIPSNMAAGSYSVQYTAVGDLSKGATGTYDETFSFTVTVPAPVALTTPSVSTSGVQTSTGVTINGTSSATDAGATITVYDGGSQIGTTTANASGNWSLFAGLSTGSHSITASASESGNYTASGVSSASTIIVDPGPAFSNASSVTVNATHPFALTAQATDAASSSITYAIQSQPGHGSASINSSTGVIGYSLSPASYVGYDSFVIKATSSNNVVTTQTITVLMDNPPTLTTSGASAIYIVGQSAQVVDGSIAITDADTPSSVAALGGGTLRANISGGDSANDSLAVAAMTLANGHVIAVSGNAVTDNGTSIGTFTGGSNGADLVITFASGVTSTQATDVAQAIKFSGGNTSSSAQRTITFTVTDGVGVSASGSDTARALLGPTILGSTYDPATGNLVLTGGAFTTSVADYTLNRLTLSGEGSSTYTLGNGDAITGTPTSTSVTIHIASSNQAAVDALLDKSGTNAVGGNAFNINAAANWDQNSTYHAPAAATNALTVASSGTPTLTDANCPAPGVASTDTSLITVESGTVTVADAPDFSGQGVWNHGNLTVSIGATNKDYSHDQLTIATSGGITLSTGMSTGSTVSYNGTAIGIIANGATGIPGQNLTVTLNASATDVALAALAQAIRYNDTATTTGGDRTLNFTVTDMYGRSSATLSNVVHVYTPPVISSVAYDVATGLLTINGTNLTLNPTDFTLSKLSITGEGSSTYTLGAADSVYSTSTTKLVIQIDTTNQAALDAILDKAGTIAATNSQAFTLAAAAGWDVSGSIVTEAASGNKTITVSSSGTPTLTDSGAATTYAMSIGGIPGGVVSTSASVADNPDLSGTGVWNSGNVTATITGAAHDPAADSLVIGSIGGITVSGNAVSYNGGGGAHQIGTISAIYTGAPASSCQLTVNLSGSYVTDAAVAALVKAIQFEDTQATATGNRSVNFTVTDGYGKASSALTETITVLPTPAIDGNGSHQGSGWTPVAITGGNVSSMVLSSSDQVVAGLNGDVYFVASGTIYRYGGTQFTSIGSSGVAGIAVSPTGAPDAGTIYAISNGGAPSLSTYSNGNYVTTVGLPNTGLAKSIAVSQDGTVAVFTQDLAGGNGLTSWTIQVRSPSGSWSTYTSASAGISAMTYYQYGPGSYGLFSPIISFVGNTDNIYLAYSAGQSPTNEVVAMRNNSGWSVVAQKQFDYTYSPFQDNQIVFAPDGSFYMATGYNYNVQVYHYTTQQGVQAIGPSMAADTSGAAYSLALTPSGTLYLANGGNYYQYDSQGNAWTLVGSAGSLPRAVSTDTDLILSSSTGTMFTAYQDGNGKYGMEKFSKPGVSYDPNTGNLTISGTNFTTNATDYGLSKFTITGETGVSSYTLGNGDAVVGTPTSTQLVIHIAATNQALVDALLDTSGVMASVDGTAWFNLSAASGWDTSGAVVAPAETINSINVVSTGTPTLADNNPTVPVAPNSGGLAVQIDNSAITATDQPDLSGAGVWVGGNLTVSFSAGQDSGHDEFVLPTSGTVHAASMAAGTSVYYNGQVIGTIKSGADGTPGNSLTITFNHSTALTDGAVQALVGAIQFEDSGTTGTIGTRTVQFVVTDAYGRSSSALTDTVRVVSGPTISGATYDPYTGILTIQGANFVGGNANVTLASLGITGEASGGTFTLSNSNASVTSVTSSAVTVLINATYQQALNAVLDRNGLSAATSGTFNLNAGAAWDSFGGTNAPAAATNVISVTSSGTPSITHGATTTTDTNVQSSLDTVDTSTLAVNDVNAGASTYFASALGAWNNGNLTVSISGASADTAHDQLSIGAIGLITTSGATAGSTVSYNGHQIGTIATGATGTPGQALTIKLSGQYATNAAVQALVNAIQFSDNGTTASIGNRTVTFTATDAYGKSASVTDTVNVVGVPAIGGASYDPFTGILTLSGTNFTTSSGNYTLASLTLSGEGSGTYTLGNNSDAISGSPTATSVTIQIASANQSAVDAILDKSGTTALVSTTHTFTLAASAGWDANGTVSAFAQAANTVTVTSTGTPTLANSNPTIASGTTIGSTPQTIDTSTITVTDAPDLSGSGMWAGGNLTVAFGATNHDTAQDMLNVGTRGGITIAGSSVSYNGNVIGAVQTGATGAPNQNLTIKFSGSSVTDAAVAALVNAIQFSDAATTTAGTRNLTFSLTDAYGRSSNALAEKVYVTPDTPPTYVNGNDTQTLNTGRNSAVTISSSTLSVKDTDVNQNETWSAGISPSHGTLSFSKTLASSGSTNIAGPVVTYTPTTNYVGSDTFTIQVSDGQGGVVAKTFNINVIAPVVQSIVRTGSGNATKATTESFTVAFNEAISGLSTANFALGTTGTVSGTIGTPTSGDGGKTWTVAVTGVTGTGTLGLNLLNNLTSITDSYSLSPSSGFTDTASLYTIDNTAPVISGVTLNAATYKIGDTVTATITTDAYDGNGAYTLAAGSAVDGATLSGWSYNTTTHSGTASFTVTTSVADVLSGSVPVSVQLADAVGNTSTAYTTGIASTIIDSHAPTAIAASSTTAPLAANGVVGTLSTTDASTGAESFTYAITGGADAAKFQITGGNTLAVAGGTTLTGSASYTVNVRSTDAGGNAYTQILTLTGASGPSSLAGGTLTYNERSSAAVIDTGVTLVNATGAANMTGATVRISSGFVAGDVLGFANQNGITGSYNSGTGVLTLTGAASFADYQTALRSVTFAAPNLYETATSSRTVTWAGTDTNGTGATAASTVSVVYVNAPPTLSLTSAASASINTAAGASGGTTLFTGANSSAVEAGQSITGVSLAVSGLADGSSEQLRIGGTWVSLTSGASGNAGGIAYSVGTITGGAATVTLAKTDTASNWNSTIGGLSYRDTAAGSSTVGARGFTLTSISDSGGTGAGGSSTTTLSNQATVTLSANDIPVITVPGGQTISNTSANAIGGVSVTDTVSGGSVTATVSALHGTLGFTGAGITANNSGSVTISAASVSALNTILGTLTYTTSLTTSGADTITVSVNDNGGSFIGGAKTASNTVAVSVTNGNPVVNAPTSLTDTLSGQYSVTGISIAEALSGPSMTATVSDSRGNLHVTAGGAAISGNDSASVTITGTLAQLNAALASLTYTTSLTATGSDVISISVSDNGKSASSSVGVTVTGNDTPIVTVAGAQSYHDTNYHAISGVSVSDSLGGASVTATLTANSGTLQVTAGSGITITGNGTGAVSISGSQAVVNTALGTLQYATTATATTSDLITVSYNDNGTNLVSGAKSASATIFVSLTGNEAPTITTPAAQSYTDALQHAISGLALADTYSNSSITATISDLHGNLNFTASGGASIGSNNSGSVTITGSLADVGATLNSLKYTTTATTTTSDTISLSVNDNGSSANLIGGSKTASTSIGIALTGNDTPVVTAPGLQSYTDTNQHAISGVSVTDSLSAASVTATVTAVSGNLNFTASGAASIGSNNSGSVTVSGSLADVNATLASLKYTTTATGTTTDTVSVSLNDNNTNGVGGAKTGSNSFQINLIGNDAPVVTVPATQDITDLTAHALSGISVSDTYTGTTVTATVSATVGTLSGTGFAGSGTGTMTITDTLANVNTALATVQYTAADNGSGGPTADVVTVQINDGNSAGVGGAKTTSRTIAITLINNDTPSITVPTQQVLTDTNAHTISGISVTDSLDGTNYSATVSDTAGLLSVSTGSGGATISGSGSTSVTVSGSTLSDVNAALATLTYTATATNSGDDTITVSVDDNGSTKARLTGDHTGTATLGVALLANDTPVLTMPARQSVTTSAANAISGIAVADTYSGSSLTATVSASNGTLSFTGSGVTGNGSGSVTISAASVGALNTILGTLNYTTTLTGTGADAITVTVDDRGTSLIGGNKTATASVNVDVIGNDTPVVNVASGQTISDTAAHAISGVGFTDGASGTSVTATVTAQHGTLNFTGGGITGNGSGSVTISGTASAVNTILGTLSYTTTATATGLDTISVTVNDGATTLVGGAKSATNTFLVDLIGNDAPTLSLASAQSLSDLNAHALSGIGITDAYSGGTVTATIQDTTGHLHATSAAGLTVAGDNTASLTLSGTLSVVNTALGTLTYSATTSGADNVTISINDGGTTLIGGAKTTSGIVEVSVAGNDAPTVTVPTARTFNDTIQHAIGGVVVADTYHNISVTATVTAQYGNLNFVNGGGAAAIAGNDTGSVTITGSLSDVNIALSTLKYTTTRSVPGNDDIAVTFNDNGTTANLLGGSKSGTGYVFIAATTAPTGPAASGTSSVPLSGSGGIPGSTVTIRDGGGTVGTTTVDGNGNWTFTPSVTEGSHSFTTQQTDPHGNIGPQSAALTTVVSLPKPPPPPPPPPQAAPVIEAPPPVAAPVEAPGLVTSIRAAVADVGAFNQGSQGGNAAVAAGTPVTSGGGFQVSLSTPSVNAVRDGSLFVAKGIPTVDVTNTNVISFAVPSDAFGHTNADAGVQLAAKLTDGRPLPPWVSFDPAKGTFVGEAPPDFKGTLSVVVVARDNAGHEVATTFRIQIGGGAVREGQPAAKPGPAEAPTKAVPPGRTGDAGQPHDGKVIKLGHAPVGKPAFTQQLKMAGRNGVFARHAALAARVARS